MSTPGDPGGAANASPRGRPARLAMLALSAFLTGAAVPGSPVHVPGIDTSLTGSPAVAQSAVYRATKTGTPARHDEDWTAPQALTRPVIIHRPKPKPAPRPRPWLPTGTGLWIHEWPKTQHGNARQVVNRAKAYGITTLYVRTGTNKGGFDGRAILRALLPATRGTNIKVVAWDFPTLARPGADAHRLAAAARYRAPGRGTPQVAAIAPDIETGSEGTRSSQHRVALYMHALRVLLPHTPILATVPWPSEQRRGHFPYGTVAHYANAVMPMTYWYNRSPTSVTAYSIRWLRRYHRPVLPVGQGYDSHVDASYLPHSHQNHEITMFFRAALHNHVSALSLWSWQTAGPAQWHALAHYRNSFRPVVHRRPARRHAPRRAVPPRHVAVLPRPRLRPAL